MDEILLEAGTILIGNLAADFGDNLGINLILTQVSQGLDQRAALTAGRGHVAWGGALEDDLALAQLNLPGGPIGQKNHSGGHLLGQT